jgi:exosortase
MPIFSIYAVWHYRQELRDAEKSTDIRGCLLLAASLMLHIAAYRAQQPRISLIAMVGVIMGIPFAFYGSRVAKLLLFPCGYLLLAFTSYFLVSLTFKLRLLSSILSVGLLNGLGIAAVRNGTAIFSPTGLFGLEVADPCSGLRSLVTITAIAAPYAWISQKKQILKWMLFFCSLPIAVLANSLRIVTIAMFAVVWGQDKALKIYHDYSGYILFFFAVLMLMAISRMIMYWQKEDEL